MFVLLYLKDKAHMLEVRDTAQKQCLQLKQGLFVLYIAYIKYIHVLYVTQSNQNWDLHSLRKTVSTVYLVLAHLRNRRWLKMQLNT